MDKLLISDKIP